MNKFFIIISTAALIFAGGCAQVPLTGRTQMALLPESTLVEMSLTSYGDFLKENKLSTNKQQTDMVKRVGTRIA